MSTSQEPLLVLYSTIFFTLCVYIYIYMYVLGMYDIYRTDKLLTDMGKKYVICIAPINKWYPIKYTCW